MMRSNINGLTPINRMNLRIIDDQKKRASISESISPRRPSDAALSFSLSENNLNSRKGYNNNNNNNNTWTSTQTSSESETQRASNANLDDLQSRVDQWRNEYYKESYLSNAENSTKLSHQIKMWKEHLKDEIKDSTESFEVQFTNEEKDFSHSIEPSPLVWSHNWHENFQQLMNNDSLFIEYEMNEMNATLDECRSSMKNHRKE